MKVDVNALTYKRVEKRREQHRKLISIKTLVGSGDRSKKGARFLCLLQPESTLNFLKRKRVGHLRLIKFIFTVTFGAKGRNNLCIE